MDQPSYNYTAQTNRLASVADAVTTDLDWDAGARYNGPALVRWFVPDPLADAHPKWSPDSYTMGNPVMLVAPDGMCPLPPCAEFDAGFRRGMWQGFTNTISGFKDANANQGPRAVYMNQTGQTVDPFTGRTISGNHPSAHFYFRP